MKKKSITVVLAVFAVLSLCLSTFWLTAKNSSVQAAPKTQQGPPPTQVANCKGSVITLQDKTAKCIVEVLPKSTAISNAATAFNDVSSQCKAMGMTIDEETVMEADAFYRGKLSKANTKYLTWYSINQSYSLPRIIYPTYTETTNGQVTSVEYGIITLGYLKDYSPVPYDASQVLNELHFTDGTAISLSQIPAICSQNVKYTTVTQPPAPPTGVTRPKTITSTIKKATSGTALKPTLLPNPVTKVVLPAQRPVRPTQTAGDQ